MCKKASLLVFASAALILGLGFKDINNQRPRNVRNVVQPVPPSANVFLGLSIYATLNDVDKGTQIVLGVGGYVEAGLCGLICPPLGLAVGA